MTFSANQLTGFYMMATLSFNELKGAFRAQSNIYDGTFSLQ